MYSSFPILPCLLTLTSIYNSVLVHTGGLHGGHYYAYVRPTLSEQWYAVTIFKSFVFQLHM